MKRDTDLDEVDELLREWAFYYADRRRFDRCRSIEHRFQPHSEDYASEGWGDMESAPKEKRPTYNLNRAIQTHEALMKLPTIQKWAITYQYCYPWLHRGMVLRVMKKWVGKPVTWKIYLEQIDIGRFRLYAWLKSN